MAKHKRTTGWTVPIHLGENVTVRVRGKSRKSAMSRANSFRRTHLKNIMAGFYDEDGIFHPIRASKDYSPSRAGEGRRGGRARAKRSTRKARPMH